MRKKKATRRLTLRQESIANLTQASGGIDPNNPPGSLGSACWTACASQSCTFAPNATCNACTNGTCNGCTLVTFGR